MSEQPRTFGRHYEELAVDAVYKHWPGRTVTEYDGRFVVRGIRSVGEIAKWCARRDSNPRPTDSKSVALSS